MDDPAKRDAAGRFGDGNRANPSGRPRVVQEYRQWLIDNLWDKSKTALREMLEGDDNRAKAFAVKEINDRILGKAPQAITDGEGGPLLGSPELLIELLKKLGGRE